MTPSDKALSISPAAAPAPLGPGLSRRVVLLAAGLVGVAGVLWLRGQTGGLRVHGPNLALLAAQPLAVKLHLATVLPAFLIGCVLMAGVKGTALHRTLGWAWVVLAAPFGLYLARRGKAATHRRMMTGLFLFGLGVAGAFTFIPGRLMYQLFFG